MKGKSKMKRILSSLILTLLLISGAYPSAVNPLKNLKIERRWSAEKAIAWYEKQSWLIGCNFIPSNAVNQLEMWQKGTFDPETIDRELGWASDIGFNIVRVYLHDMLWQQDSYGFMNRIDQFLAIAKKHNIKVMFVLLDSCWNPFPKLGKQPEPKPHVHNSGWVQSPHINLLKDTAKYDNLEGYVKGVVSRYRNDDRVIIWDVYNEPGNRNGVSYGSYEPPNKEKLACKLLEKAFAWIREVNPEQPVTSGVWVGEWQKNGKITSLNRFMLNNSDVITFHSYSSPDNIQLLIPVLKEYSRPIICTEYMSRGTGCTFQNILPIFKQHGIGAINWGLVAGKTQTQYPWASWTKQYTSEPELWFHDIIRRDGTPFDKKEVKFIREIAKTSDAS
jgi:hypothetical protein